jgi:hypothetical protein
MLHTRHPKYPYSTPSHHILKKQENITKANLQRNDQIMEAACANLYNVDAKKVKYCFEQGYDLGLKYTDCGYRFVAKCRNISNCLNAFAYVYNIPCKNTIFSTLRSIQQTCITFKGANIKPAITLKLPPMDINLRVPTLQELEVMIETRKDIPFHIERDRSLLFAPKRQTVHSFHRKISSGKMFLALKELWHLRKDKTAEEFARYCLQDVHAPTLVHMSLCALRVAMANAPAKELPQVPVLIGPTIEPVMKTLVRVVFELHGRNQARYIQVLLPALLSYWFSCRQTNSYLFKVISKAEYEARKRMVEMPMLMFGIHLIVHEDHTFQLMKIETKTTGGMAKTADVDWYEEEIYSRLPYAKEVLPLILCSYNLLTQNNIPEASEERRYISNHYDPFEAGYRVLTYHSFPLILPVYKFGSTSYLTPPHKTPYVKQSAADILKNTPYALQRSWTSNAKLSAYLINPMRMPNAAKMEDYVVNSNDRTCNAVRVSMSILEQVVKDMVDEKCLYTVVDGNRKRKVSLFPKAIYRPLEANLELYTHALKAKYLGRYYTGSNMLEVNAELDIPCLRELNEVKLKQLMRIEAHLSKAVLKKNYDAFWKYGELNEFSKLTSRIYRSVLVERLSAHPCLKPGVKYTGFVAPTDTTGHLKARCGDTKRLTIANGEQTAQLIVVNDFYDALDCMREYQKQLGVLPSSFNVKLAEMEDYVKQAKERWRVKFGKRQRE